MIQQVPTLLLVDDDDAHLMVAERAINRSHLGVQVRLAHDGYEALRVLGVDDDDHGSERAPVVLVMLDLSMPGITGWEVLRRLRAAHHNVPVVVVSDSWRPDDVRRSYELGANGYLVKRYDAGRPGGYMADAARYWVELNSPPARSWAS